jgi:pyruvate dehydrogenase E1 component alpha subunit
MSTQPTSWTPESLRAFEEEVRDIYAAGRIRAPVHLSRRNEKQLLKIFQDVKADDWVFSTYRSHYHALLKGIPREKVLAEILAGHSIHLEFPEHRFYSSAIVAGCLPIALGTALGIQRWGATEKVYCFVGDMAALGGAFHETMQYARGFHLPLVLVVECNSWSTNTPTYQTWGSDHKHSPCGPELVAWWENGKVLKYCYDREFPHYGIGTRVDFDQASQAPAEVRSDLMA